MVGSLDVDGANPGAPRIGGGLAAIREPAALLVTTNPTSAPYELLEIDPLTGQIAARFEHGLGSGVLGVAVHSGQIYLGRNTGGSLNVYSRDGSLLRTVTVPGAVGFQSLGGDDAELPIDVSKSVTPQGAVSPGERLTYTLRVSTTPGAELGIYDPLTHTTFVHWLGPVPPGIVYDGGAITGTLTVTPAAQLSLTFVVEVPAGATVEVANRGCAYARPGGLDRCRWSNRVANDIRQAPGTPVLLSPPDGTITGTQAITFAWQPAAGPMPDGYNLDLDGSLFTTTATVWPSLLAPGTHHWAVRAYNAAGYSPWTAAWSLEIRRFTVYLPLVYRLYP